MGSPVLAPTSKVTTAAVAGSIVTVLAWLVNVIWHVNLPFEVGTLINLVVMFSAAYMKREKVKF